MSDQITVAMKNTYAQNVEHLVQQKTSRLRGAVKVRSGMLGEKHFVDQIGTVEPVAITSRHGDSPLNDTPHDRRLLTLTDYELGDIVDKPDIVRTLTSPASDYAVAQSRGFGRQVDRVIIAALEGTALSDHTGSTSNTLAAANTVDRYVVDGGSGASANLTVDKLRKASEIMNAFEVDDENRFIAVSASQISSLLRDSEITSQDFNIVRALVRGEVNAYMGFIFLRTELLTVASNIRDCLAWQRDCLLLGEGIGINTQVDPARSDKRFNPYIYTTATWGAVRMEEKCVVKVQCDETA